MKRLPCLQGLSVTVLSVVVGLWGLSLCTGCSTSSNGSDSNATFDPEITEIVVGDTIRWTAVSGDHTVTSGTDSDDPDAGDLFDAELPQGEEFTYVFDAAGDYDYFCRPHEAEGMSGQITVTEATPTTVPVSASGTAFSPVNVEIHVGDTVRWTSSGSHTITSGENSAAGDAGDLFDEQLTNAQSFTYVFDAPGVYPYFCRLHEFSGMTGTVTVMERESKTVTVEASI